MLNRPPDQVCCILHIFYELDQRLYTKAKSYEWTIVFSESRAGFKGERRDCPVLHTQGPCTAPCRCDVSHCNYPGYFTRYRVIIMIRHLYISWFTVFIGSIWRKAKCPFPGADVLTFIFRMSWHLSSTLQRSLPSPHCWEGKELSSFSLSLVLETWCDSSSYMSHVNGTWSAASVWCVHLCPQGFRREPCSAH